VRVLLAPFGSRGDVAPLLALGQALRARGHGVLVAPPGDMATWVRSFGFDVADGVPAFRECFDGTHFEGAVVVRAMRRVPVTYAALERAALDFRPDLVVGSMMAWTAPSIATQVGARYAYAVFSPLYLRNLTLPLLAIPLRRTPRWLAQAHWWLSDHAPPVMHRVLDRERARRGLPPAGRLYDHLVESGRILLAADASIAPLPADARAMARAPLDGTPAWMLDEPAPPLPALDRLLSAPGPPVVYLGFGSMVHGDGARLARLLQEAIQRADVRAVIGAGWSGVEAAGLERSGALVLGDVPHSAVFPRVAAIVHHGGAGTTARAARAGVPQVVVSHLGDQHWHGWRVHEMGLGPPPLLERGVTATKLAAAIRAALADEATRANARALGRELAGVDGTAEAVRMLERG